MDTTKRVDYVRSEFDRMQSEFDSELKEIFSDKGSLVRSLDRFLGEKSELRRSLDAHFGEQGSVIYKILNPDDETTPLGKSGNSCYRNWIPKGKEQASKS